MPVAKNGMKFDSDDWQTYEKFWKWLSKKYEYRVDLASSNGNRKIMPDTIPKSTTVPLMWTGYQALETLLVQSPVLQFDRTMARDMEHDQWITARLVETVSSHVLDQGRCHCTKLLG